MNKSIILKSMICLFLILFSTISLFAFIEETNAQVLITGYYYYDTRNGIWVWTTGPWRATYRKTLITISIKGLPPEYSTIIIVDGKQAGTIQGGTSKSFEVDKRSSHVFQVDKIVKGEQFEYEGISISTRYVCPGDLWTVELVQREVYELIPVVNWINRTRGEYFVTYVPITRTISELAESGHTFEYYAEHEVFVMNPHGTNLNEWFKEDSSINLYAKEIVPIENKKDERDVFQYWSINGIPNEANTVSFKINKPYVVKAVYEKEYRIKLFSEYGHPALDKIEGWYRKGEEATISIEHELPLEGWKGFLGGKRIFNGWYSNIGLESKNPKFTFIVEEPKTLYAEWRIDETMPIAIIVTILAIIVILAFSLFYKKGYLKSLTRISKIDELELEIKNIKAEIEGLKKQLRKKEK